MTTDQLYTSHGEKLNKMKVWYSQKLIQVAHCYDNLNICHNPRHIFDTFLVFLVAFYVNTQGEEKKFKKLG